MAWEDISAHQYADAFERFGGSFAVHPRVVGLIAELSGLAVRYVGYAPDGALQAALPLWGEFVVATPAAQSFYRCVDLLDTGESEILLPIAPKAAIPMPFVADMISPLHSNQIKGLRKARHAMLMLTKGLARGEHRLSGRHQKNLRRKLRKLDQMGAVYRPIRDIPPSEAADLFWMLHKKRWDMPPPAPTTVHRVFETLHDMLAGDVMYIDDQPVAIEHMYRHETPDHVMVNAVQAGWDPAWQKHSVGSLLLFRNLAALEAEAHALGKVLRYNLGWNDQGYKSQWAVPVPAYIVGTLRAYAAKARTLWWLRRH